MAILIKNSFHTVIIFETNNYIYRNGYLQGWLLTVNVMVDKGGVKFW